MIRRAEQRNPSFTVIDHISHINKYQHDYIDKVTAFINMLTYLPERDIEKLYKLALEKLE